MQEENFNDVNEERKIFTITEITRGIKDTLETNFANMWIEGEVSDLKRPSSGHLYFILKDESSQLRAVMFRYNNQRLRFPLENGIKVIGFGTIGVYEKRGEYQIILEVMEPAGLGALQLAFEKLKKKLNAEGLFDSARKRPIPVFPRKIGVVTSPTGAAIKDILNVINRRFCNVHIVINPVRVQGVEAPGEIAAAIRELNKFDDIDVMIVGRGGGSLEDLWAFNEEIVARAIYESRIPVISAVGHEIDYTIADFVADLRAPTPSAAAELVVQNKSRLENEIKIHVDRITASINKYLIILKNKVEYLSANRCLIKPAEIFQDRYQRIDELLERIKELTIDLIEKQSVKINTLQNSIIHLGPYNKIAHFEEKISALDRRLIMNMQHTVDRLNGDLNIFIGKLNSLNPLAILSRGYSLTFALPERKLLTSSSDTSPGNELEIKLDKGEVICEVKRVIT